jgi:predicted tellurium resistance membrane protein TerC
MIVLADLVMSLDNILAVGGAAHNNIGLLLFGLALSIPLVLFGSTILTTALQRWPVLNYVGAGVLAWTAGRMVVHDTIIHHWLDAAHFPMLDNLLPSLGLAIVLGLGYRTHRKQQAANPAHADAHAPEVAAGDRPDTEA